MKLREQMDKKERLVIGLMSGTSADGVDAALVRVSGCGVGTKVRQLGFITTPFSDEVRQRILEVAGGGYGGSSEICRLGFLLGKIFADSCLALCEKTGVLPSDIDLVGSHGQTVWHIPEAEGYLGGPVRGTLQIGEPSLICEALGCIVVSDFRVRDMAAGGLGAPLVPYTEFLLYRDEGRDVALQNIGGIGNVTCLPKGCQLSDVFAFDTGPGNMVMDQLVAKLTGGRQSYDDGGRLAGGGSVHPALLGWLMEDEYLRLPPPKTTGRERYGSAYVEALLGKASAMGVSLTDTLATATCFTAACIEKGIRGFFPRMPGRLVVGDGGARNPTLMGHIRRLLPETEVLCNEDLGFDGDAKEAVAFAVLANEAICGIANNAPGATGAAHPVVMGKISQF